jgi:hypothetical protein
MDKEDVEYIVNAIEEWVEISNFKEDIGCSP